jgi:uncharacterized protein YcnI
MAAHPIWRMTATIAHPAAVCAAALTLQAATAMAHVTVWPREAPAKGFQVFSVRVPTEREAATVSVRLEFPAGLKSVRFMPKPGWKYEIEREAGGGIVGVTWSGGRIGRDEFDEFHFTARMPDEPTRLTFVAHQTYEDGEVVHWADPEGSRPAAKVEVTGERPGASAASADHGAAPPADTQATARPAAPLPWTNWAALLISVVALALALRPRRSA